MHENQTSTTVATPLKRSADIRRLANAGIQLRTRYCLTWSAADQELARALAFDEVRDRPDARLTLVALVGGASSGKSTLFNNLLGGHYASQVQVHSHTTLGPILALHEDCRDLIGNWIKIEKTFFPSYEPVEAGLEESAAGQAGRLTLIRHSNDALRDVLLFDMPDFTSEAARQEGDQTLNLLPWFDRLVVMLDSERWSDRQSLSELAQRAGALGQPRLAVFNCTDDVAPPTDTTIFQRQSATLASEAWTFVEYRRGRGLRRLPPEPLDAVMRFVRQPTHPRAEILLRRLGRIANNVLNTHEQRAHALSQLRRSLLDNASSMIPPLPDCLQATMTDAERGQLRIVTRILGTASSAVTHWADGLRSILWNTAAPLKGLFSLKSPVDKPAITPAQRIERGLCHFDDQCRRQWRRLHGLSAASQFQGELEQDDVTDIFDPTAPEAEPLKNLAAEKLAELDQALAVWNRKVEQECKGLSPHLYGAAGGTMLGIAVVLIAVQGPLSVLTIPAAMAAISAAMAKLAVAASAGALLGKHAGRLAHAVHEQLLGSPELQSVQSAAEAYRGVLAEHSRECVRALLDQAAHYVMPPDEPLVAALQSIRLAGDIQ